MINPEDCTHWWILPMPDGRDMLPARCKHCGLDNEFPAYLPGDAYVSWKINDTPLSPRDLGIVTIND